MYSESDNDPRLKEARMLIQAKQCDEARELLLTIDNPAARNWLAKLDSHVERKKSKEARSNMLRWVILALMIGLICGSGLGYVVGRESVVPRFDNPEIRPTPASFSEALKATATSIVATNKAVNFYMTLTAQAND